MSGPINKAAVSAGVTIGVIASVVMLVMFSKNLQSCGKVVETSNTTQKPETTVVQGKPFHIIDTVHAPIPDSVVNRLDSLRFALAEKDSALAAALWELQREVEIEGPWRWEGLDTLGNVERVVVGSALFTYCALNGTSSRSVWVDSLITPEHIVTITKTVFVVTGVEWHWLPVAFILGALVAVGLYVWTTG